MGTVLIFLDPMFRTRLLQLRHARNLTQQALADMVHIHVNQVRRYERGATTPTLEVLIRIARTLNVSLDDLVFNEADRGPSAELALQFEAVSNMPDAERNVIKALLEGMIVNYQTKQIVRNLNSATPRANPDSPSV
jgi:transcriptional regulator with XRE-family HTH domain